MASAKASCPYVAELRQPPRALPKTDLLYCNLCLLLLPFPQVLPILQQVLSKPSRPLRNPDLFPLAPTHRFCSASLCHCAKPATPRHSHSRLAPAHRPTHLHRSYSRSCNCCWTPRCTSPSLHNCSCATACLSSPATFCATSHACQHPGPHRQLLNSTPLPFHPRSLSRLSGLPRQGPGQPPRTLADGVLTTCTSGEHRAV